MPCPVLMTDSSSPCILGSFATNDRSHGGPLGGGRPLRLIACRRAFCFISSSLHLYLYSICERVEACEALNTPTTCHLHGCTPGSRFAICHMRSYAVDLASAGFVCRFCSCFLSAGCWLGSQLLLLLLALGVRLSVCGWLQCGRPALLARRPCLAPRL